MKTKTVKMSEILDALRYAEEAGEVDVIISHIDELSENVRDIVALYIPSGWLCQPGVNMEVFFGQSEKLPIKFYVKDSNVEEAIFQETTRDTMVASVERKSIEHLENALLIAPQNGDYVELSYPGCTWRLTYDADLA